MAGLPSCPTASPGCPVSLFWDSGPSVEAHDLTREQRMVGARGGGASGKGERCVQKKCDRYMSLQQALLEEMR